MKEMVSVVRTFRSRFLHPPSPSPFAGRCDRRRLLQKSERRGLLQKRWASSLSRAATSKLGLGLDNLYLNKGIAELYDESSGFWENMWGDHVHHGFYDPDVHSSSISDPRSAQIHMIQEAFRSAANSDPRSAQIRMIEEVLRFAAVSDDSLKRPKSIVDVGCGIGGSSRYLASKYGSKCQGITLSSVEAQRAQTLTVAEGLSDKVSFQVADALEQPFPDGQFDLVWSLESGVYMPDKIKFISELARVAAPGATIIIVTWCHRDVSASEESLKSEEEKLLSKISDLYHLPGWCSAADFVKIAQSLSLEDIKTADWSDNAAPFWPTVIRSTLTWKGFTLLLGAGWKTIRGAFAIPLIYQGYKQQLVKYAIITCRKPQ